MGFGDEMDQHQKEMQTNGSFFKFKKDGDYKFRIMAEPVKKVSRFGYGICYEGAPYCQKDALDKEWEEKKAKAVADGKDPSKVARPNVTVKWMTWAYHYATESFLIFEMANTVATAVLEFMRSDEYGFKEWPMPYDIMIKVKNAGIKEVEYTVLPARQNTPVSDALMEEYGKLTPIAQIKERLQAKQKEKVENGGQSKSGGIDYPEDDINAEDIPF